MRRGRKTTEDGEQGSMGQDQHTPRSNRLAPLVQVALAVLVAGSLLAFSALAFRTGFSASTNSITADAPDSHARGAVVLPNASPSRAQAEPTSGATVAAVQPEPDRVLGTRVAQTPDRKPAGRGDNKNHKPRPDLAHGPDDGNGDGKGGDNKHISSTNDGPIAREEDEGWADRGDHGDDDGDDSHKSGHGTKHKSEHKSEHKSDHESDHGSDHGSNDDHESDHGSDHGSNDDHGSDHESDHGSNDDH